MKKIFLYHYTQDEVDEAVANDKCWVCEEPRMMDRVAGCCKNMRYQYGCNGCGGSFDPNYGGEIESETDRPNMCGYCLDKGVII
tara:strand:- start:1590 stop:1841 length:252 start_codon:yes stop_codon:yes gene_type:complete